MTAPYPFDPLECGDDDHSDSPSHDPGVPTPTESATDYDYAVNVNALFTALANVSEEQTV